MTTDRNQSNHQLATGAARQRARFPIETAGVAALGALLCGVVLTTGAVVASADVPATHSSYTALFCKSWNSNVGFNYSKAKVFNGSTTTTFSVNCPIVRRNMDAAIDAGSTVRVKDSNPNTGKDVVCTLRANYNSGSVAYSTDDSQNRSAAGNSGVQTITFESLPAANTYMLGCSLPEKWNGAASEVRSYTIHESDATW